MGNVYYSGAPELAFAAQGLEILSQIRYCEVGRELSEMGRVSAGPLRRANPGKIFAETQENCA